MRRQTRKRNWPHAVKQMRRGNYWRCFLECPPSFQNPAKQPVQKTGPSFARWASTHIPGKAGGSERCVAEWRRPFRVDGSLLATLVSHASHASWLSPEKSRGIGTKGDDIWEAQTTVDYRSSTKPTVCHIVKCVFARAAYLLLHTCVPPPAPAGQLDPTCPCRGIASHTVVASIPRSPGLVTCGRPDPPGGIWMT